MVGIRMQEHVALLGDEPEQQSINQPQQCSLVEVCIKVFAKPVVSWVLQEASAEVANRFGHPAAELLEEGDTGLDRFDAPFLQPAG
jgi:hypothetical protein